MIPYNLHITYTRRPWGAACLAGAMLVAFVAGNPTMSHGGWLPWLAMQTDEDFRWWQVFTSTFTHDHLGHVAGNAMVTWLCTHFLEERVGTPRMLLAFLISLLAANLTYFVVTGPIMEQSAPVIGASGTAAGLLGMGVVMAPKIRMSVLFFRFRGWRITGFETYYPYGWIFLAYFILHQVWHVWVGNDVAIWAHVGGFATGLLLGAWFRKTTSPVMYPQIV